MRYLKVHVINRVRVPLVEPASSKFHFSCKRYLGSLQECLLCPAGVRDFWGEGCVGVFVVVVLVFFLQGNSLKVTHFTHR